MNFLYKTKNTIMNSKVTKNNVNVGSESIDDIGKRVVGGESVLMPDEYTNFWSRISKDKSSCARYMARIVVQLLNYEQSSVKAGTSNKIIRTSQDLMQINLLLNTILFIDMFIGFDPKNEAFLSAMEKFEQAKAATPIFKNKDISEGLSDLSKRRAHRGLAAVKMIVECSSLESAEEIILNSSLSLVTSSSATSSSAAQLRPANNFPISADDHEDNSWEKAVLDYPFTFTCLSRMTKAEHSPMIFDELLKQLEGAGSALSSMAHMQGRTLALMFMLREFLTISPTADHMWMQRACLVLIGLYKWPKPYGIVARDLLMFIDLERRSPGCHLRERLISETRGLHPVVMLRRLNLPYTPLHPRDPHSPASRSRHHEKEFDYNTLLDYFVPLSRTCPIAFVFLDKSVPVCGTHKHLLLLQQSGRATEESCSLDSQKSSDKQNDELNEMKIDIISNIFDTDFVIFPDGDPKIKKKIPDPLGLASLSEEDLTLLYCQVLEVLERAKTLPVNAGLGGEPIMRDLSGQPYTIPGGLSKLYRESLLGSLLTKLHPDKLFAPRRSSDQKVNYIIRQSRRTSQMQLENVSDRRSSLTDDNEYEETEEIVAEARSQSRRGAKLMSPDKMDMMEGAEEEGGADTSNRVFNGVQNTVHDPVLFGQRAPIVPEAQLEVIEVKKKRRNIGDDLEGARTSHSPSRDNYVDSTNAAGYLHIKQDVNDLISVISKARQEWADSFSSPAAALGLISDIDEKVRRVSWRDVKVSASTDRDSGDLSSPPEKLKIKIVLMGSNMVIHRFLAAYIALYTDLEFDISDFSLEVFVIPQGRNHLGVYLARADKWYRRHIFDSFKGSLGVCPLYSAGREYGQLELDGLNMESCLPVTNIRQLLHDYIRQASQKFHFNVFECLCWAAYDSSGKSRTTSEATDVNKDDMDVFNKQSEPADVIIPFMMQVQLGLRAQIEQFREKPSSMSKLEREKERELSIHTHHEKSTLTMRECFADKDALFSLGVDLTLKYLPSSITSLDAKASASSPPPSTTQVDSFATISLSNFPIHNTSRDNITNRKRPAALSLPNGELVMESQLNKGPLVDLFQNRKKSAKSMENFLDALHDENNFEHPQHIGAIEIHTTNVGDSFHILVDGSLYGPFHRLIIRSCQARDVPTDGSSKDEQSHAVCTLPIMTYMPLDH